MLSAVPQDAPLLVKIPSAPTLTQEMAPESEPIERVSEMSTVPFTLSAAEGEVEAMPTLPELSIVTALVVGLPLLLVLRRNSKVPYAL